MIYRIFHDGEEINRIVADEEFVAQYCQENGYTYEATGMAGSGTAQPAEPDPTAEEQLRADVDYLAAMMGVSL